MYTASDVLGSGHTPHVWDLNACQLTDFPLQSSSGLTGEEEGKSLHIQKMERHCSSACMRLPPFSGEDFTPHTGVEFFPRRVHQQDSDSRQIQRKRIAACICMCFRAGLYMRLSMVLWTAVRLLFPICSACRL